MQLTEYFTLSKSGDEKLNEDGIYISDSFIAVFDGATSKRQGKIGGLSSGRFAMLAVKSAFADINPLDQPIKVLQFINSRLAEEVKKADAADCDSPSVCVLYCNLIRKEIVSYGDCAYAVNGKIYKTVKDCDISLSKKRARVVKQALKNGASAEDLRKNDIGRSAILNDLIIQADKYSNREGGYPCVNGGEILSGLIQSLSVKDGDEIILCSDGYPVIKQSLAESESLLADLLKKDILCIDELCGTKGVAQGNLSFDDRTYVRFTL